jgi:molecular chaperone GrpE
MPEQNTHSAMADAALESVTAEVQSQAQQAKEAANSSAADRKVAELEQQLRDCTEKALRSSAELENYRKRAQRELADERKYAVVPLARDLLPVLDNLERAIEAADRQARGASEGKTVSGSSDLSHLLDGIKMVANQLEAVLKQHECIRIETVGTPFDPNQHQAIAQEPSDEYPAGTVTRAVQVGYKLHDRVIRPAQVFVSTGSAQHK